MDDELERESEGTLDSFGYALVQARLAGRVGNRTLTVLIDKPGGITSSDCQYMASRLSVLLDALDPIDGRYTLVVSSPGVDRPLTSEADFERFAGSKIRLRWSELGEKPRTLIGTLLGVRDEHARVEVEGTERETPLADIEAANILYDWEQDDEANT
jgi:ribosome maturation factor RimP